jgi:hypothetical protein
VGTAAPPRNTTFWSVAGGQLLYKRETEERPPGENVMSSTAAFRVFLLIAASVMTVCAAVATSAQQTTLQPRPAAPASVPADVTDKLGSDLAKLQAGIQASQQQLAASPGERKQLQVTSDNAYVLSGANASASREFTAKKGEKLYVLDRTNDFYAVVADNGTTGWIPASDVKPIFKAGYNKWDKPFDYDTWGTEVTTSSVQNAAPPADSSMTARVFKSLAEQAVQFRDSYKDNKYMYVSGFTVHVGIPPSVDLAFSFR